MVRRVVILSTNAISWSSPFGILLNKSHNWMVSACDFFVYFSAMFSMLYLMGIHKLPLFRASCVFFTPSQEIKMNSINEGEVNDCFLMLWFKNVWHSSIDSAKLVLYTRGTIQSRKIGGIFWIYFFLWLKTGSIWIVLPNQFDVSFWQFPVMVPLYHILQWLSSWSILFKSKAFLHAKLVPTRT